MDICIVNHPREVIPFENNYELLLKPEQVEEGLGEGGKLQLAKHRYICFRRRKHRRTTSYITEVRLVCKSQESPPQGFELIEKTVGGASGDLSRGGSQQVYLAVRYAHVDETSFRFSIPPVLADLCLCSDEKGGSAPMEYTVLPRPLSRLGLPNENIYLAYQQGPSAGLCDIPYEAYSLDWFPHEATYEDFPLPQNELPMFCFPKGVVLKHQKRNDTPMPSYFSFVFTSIDGDRVHVACLQFYELLPDRVLRALEAKQRILTVLGAFASGENPTESGGPISLGEWDSDEESVASSVDEEEEESVEAVSSTSGQAAGVETGIPKSSPSTQQSPGRRAATNHNGLISLKCKERALSKSISTGTELPRQSSLTGVPVSKSFKPAGRSDHALFAPKCICIISHWPFYRALRSFLQQIYRISLSPSRVPLERYIAYFTHYMPLPPPGQHVLNLHLDLGMQDRIENSTLAPITLHLPDTRSLPLMDLDYEAPFRCLSLDNVLKIFVLLLMEERLLFMSSSTSLLTEVTETILTLLFPLEWTSCYIPRLPNKLTEILDAPGSFLIGIYIEGTTDSWVLPQLSDPLFVVDLDHDCIIDAENKDYTTAMENMPILEALREKLRTELDRTGVTVKSAEALREGDSAFELPAVPGSQVEDGPAMKLELNVDIVRDAFLVFMCELLGSYTRYFNSQQAQLDDTDACDMAHNGVFGAFDVSGFLASAEKTTKALLERVLLTQMFAALVQQRTDHGRGIDRLVFFETCVEELKERKDAEAAATTAGANVSLNIYYGAASNPKKRPDDRTLSTRSVPLPTTDSANGPPLLIHQAVASMLRREQLLLQQQLHMQLQSGATAPSVSPSTTSPQSACPEAALSPRQSQSSPSFFVGTLPRMIIIPGPSAEGCYTPRQSHSYLEGNASQNHTPSAMAQSRALRFSYKQFPNTLNKTWMDLPPSSLPPILLEIISRRKKSLKKGKRMILARSVSECVKDWQTVGKPIGGARDKEIYLAMQIFGIYFMCLPSRVSYKGKPLRVIMQAMGILQYILGFELEGYMDEAMWRSLLIACGRCGQASTRKIAIAIFGIMRRAGLSINALTYGQYTKALAEKDAAEFVATTTGLTLVTSGCGERGRQVPDCRTETGTVVDETRGGIDDSPWLEERGRGWYLAACEPSAPETLKNWSVADGFKSLLAGTMKAVVSRKARERPVLQDGDAWTSGLRDPRVSAQNTTLSSITMNSAGVIGMWVVCLCVKCEYMPLDEEIMTLRQEQAVDDQTNHLLLCPKCETPLMPRLYYDIKTFKDHVMDSCSMKGEKTKADFSTQASQENILEISLSSYAESSLHSSGVSTGGNISMPTEANKHVASKMVEPQAILEQDVSGRKRLSASNIFSPAATAWEDALSGSVAEKTAREQRGEISGLPSGTTGGDHVGYLSPFTLRMRLEKLLLEDGEMCLTRDWARTHQPELYWNLVWFTTRLSIPFPFLLDSLDPSFADAAMNSFSTTSPDRMGSNAQPTAEKAVKGYFSNTFRSIHSPGMSRQDSTERLAQFFFHEVVVVGWEGEVVRNRCEKVETMLKQRSFELRVTPPKASSNVGSYTITGAGVLPTFQLSVPSISTTMTLSEALRQQIIGVETAMAKTVEYSDAIGPLTVAQLLPNISTQELEAIEEVKRILLIEGCAGLKEAITQFFILKEKQGGWTSEASLGSPYRVFLKLAANFHIKKLHNIAPISNLMANPGLEHEYTTAVMRLGDRFVREKAGQDERQLLAELPKRDAIKFRSAFGPLY